MERLWKWEIQQRFTKRNTVNHSMAMEVGNNVINNRDNFITKQILTNGDYDCKISG